MNPETNIHQIGGLHKTEIESLVEGLKSRITALEKVVCANGRPGLEERVIARIMAEIATLRVYVDERDNHKQNSLTSAFKDLAYLLDRLAVKQDERHDQNTARFNGITEKMAYGAGACAVIVVLVNHFWR